MMLTCLATVAYLEARGEGLAGMRAVADVVLTRAEESGRGVCEVVAEPGQFAYDPSLVPKEPMAWRAAVGVAREALHSGPPPKGATHFHEREVRPAWTNGAIFCGRVGRHLFWRIES
jgi:spore germination cell wall hydrolase CwlJ-like protein